MSGSQLSIEFESMPDRYELYAKFGIAAEAAQLFETELGTLLLGFRGLEKNWHIEPDGAAARVVLDKIDRSTLGKHLDDLRNYINFEGGVEDVFFSGLAARNQLAHGYFERHGLRIQTPKGRMEMIAELERLHGDLFTAWRAASDLGTVVSTFVLAMRLTHT